jgi:Zn-dependent M28 family amino/carboxypeptidase
VRERRTVENVGARIAPSGATEWVVIGAHYDHLGYGGSDSLAEGDKPQIHNGADDNASGTAVVIEAARAISKMQDGLHRGVIFVLFAGEESGLLGSAHMVKHSPVPADKIAAMINLDMVGHLRDKKLNVMGVKTALEFPAFTQRMVMRQGLIGSLGGDGYGPSDHTSFYAEGVPVLFLFTGAHTHYHKPSDDPGTLNYPGMAEVGAVATDLVRALATAKARPTYVKAAPPKLGDGARGYGPYFGSIPDFGEHEGGVLLAGVREGSPAAKAGIQKGDVIVKFGEYEVRNLQDMTIALREHAPGDTISVAYLRGGKRIEVSVVLAKRE